jgi:hypothetical protein
MSGCPLSGSALAYASACSSHPHQPGTDALETLCPAAHACLSERAEELSDRDGSLLSIDLRPQSPPQVTSLECLLKTLRPWMQIRTSAGLELANIDGDACATRN